MESRSSKVALNGTQRNIIEGLLKDYIDDILALNQSDAIKALQAVIAENVLAEEKALFEKQDIWADVAFIREILTHPCPQNRAVSYPYFGAPSDPSMVVYKDSDGNVAFEQKGLLGLTARNDSTAPPVSKEAVVIYIHELVNTAIAQKKLASNVTDSPATQPTLFADNKKQEEAAIKQIKTMLSAEELKVIPVMALARLPMGARLAYCDNVRRERGTPFAEREELYFGPDNYFLAGVEALLLRGVKATQFLQLSKEKQVILALDEATWLLMDIGVDFDKMSKLNVADLTDMFSWLRSDVSRAMQLCSKYEDKLMHEVNQLIDSKLTSYSPSTFINH